MSGSNITPTSMPASHNDSFSEFTVAELTEINTDPNANDNNDSRVSPSPGADVHVFACLVSCNRFHKLC